MYRNVRYSNNNNIIIVIIVITDYLTKGPKLVSDAFEVDQA